MQKIQECVKEEIGSDNRDDWKKGYYSNFQNRDRRENNYQRDINWRRRDKMRTDNPRVRSAITGNAPKTSHMNAISATGCTLREVAKRQYEEILKSPCPLNPIKVARYLETVKSLSRSSKIRFFFTF